MYRYIILSIIFFSLTACQTTGVSSLKNPVRTGIFPDGKYKLVSSDEKKKLPDFMSLAEIKTENDVVIVDMGTFKFVQQWQLIGDHKIVELRYIGDGKSKVDVDAFLYFKVENDPKRYLIRPLERKECRRIYNELSGGNKDVKIFEQKSDDGKSKSSITVSGVNDATDIGNWVKTLGNGTAFDNAVIECVKQ
jgi:hypothetical protein